MLFTVIHRIMLGSAYYCVRHWWSLKCLGWAYLAILVRKSIFENPVLFDSISGCRNKTEVGPFGFDWAWFGFGGGGFYF
jgi:hypothetical protein